MNSFLETLKQLGPARLGIMGAVVLGLLIFFIFLSLRVSTPSMNLLYSDLTTNDSSAIAAKLEESEIPFEISQDGTKVSVPENDVGRARMLLAEAGLPNGGSLGYEIFDKQSGFGTTNFIQNINQVRALEGELARTISSVEGVRSARVHLVLPERELFSRDTKPSSASVFLGVRPGAQLSREQILAIQSLVSSAVPGLKPANVSLIDNQGNLLAKGGEEEINLMATKAEEMRRSYESNLTGKIEDQVAKIVGFGNVRATVTAEVNFDRISTNEELFDPDKQVVRSSQVTQENNLERDAAPKDVSVQNNLPGVGDALLSDEKPTSEGNRSEEVTNYEINKTVRNTVREVGEIKRLSVAVLVDGRYKTAEDGTQTYEARPQEEIDHITALVKSAVGFDESRGDSIEVVNLQFAEVDSSADMINDDKILGFEKSQLLDFAELLIVGVMIVLVILLVLQPMINRLIESGAPSRGDEGLEADLLTAGASMPALTGPSSENDFRLADHSGGAGDEDALISIQGVEGKVKASAVRKVEEIIANYPAETVSVLRSWMTQEP